MIFRIAFIYFSVLGFVLVSSQTCRYLSWQVLEAKAADGSCTEVLRELGQHNRKTTTQTADAYLSYVRAFAYNQCEDYRQATNILQQLLKSKSKILRNDQKLLQKTYFQLAYAASGDYNQKHEIFYTRKALDVMQRSPKLFSLSEMISAYNDYFFYQNNYGEFSGMELTEREFSSIFNQISTNDSQYAYARRVYRKMQILVALINDDTEKAIRTIEKFKKESAADNQPDDFNYINSCYSQLAGYYYDKKAYRSCIRYSYHSAKYARETKFPHYEMVAYSKIGASYLRLSEFAKALEYVERSLSIVRNKEDFNSSLYSLNTLKSMALAGLGHYDEATQLIEENIKQILHKKTGNSIPLRELHFKDVRLISSHYFINIFASSADVYLQKYQESKDKEDIEKAERFFLIASEMFREFYLKGEFNPLLYNLHNKITEGLLNIALEKYNTDQKKIIEILDRIENNSSKHLYKEFIRKRKDKTLSSSVFNELSDIRNITETIMKSIPEDGQMVKFYVGSNHVFQLVMTKRNLQLVKLGKTAVIKKYTDQHIRLSKSPSIITSNSDKLRGLLLPQLHRHKIIIISDDFLNYLPFESLTSKGKYLVEDFEFSYHYSMSLWLVNQTSAKSNNVRVAVFAPAYNEAIFKQNKMKPLPFARQESEDILRQFPGQLFAGSIATKENFYDQASRSDIIHLSMHAVLDENDFRKSGLIFQGNQPLYFDEIYQKTIPVEMMVLGACNTGTGMLKNGEGIMSMAHAFTVAGSRSNIISLWEVPDRETSELMQYFYVYLKKGQEKDEALSNAKREFLKHNPLKQHPYFWAGFIVNGSIEPLATNYSWILVVSLVATGILLIVYILKRKKSLYF